MTGLPYVWPRSGLLHSAQIGGARRLAAAFALFVVATAGARVAAAVDAVEQPQWIWIDARTAAPAGMDTASFRKVLAFGERPKAARIWITADDRFTLWVNGREAGAGTLWRTPVEIDLAPLLVPGENLLAVHASNDRSAAGLLARIEISPAEGPPQVFVSDRTWLTSRASPPGFVEPQFDASDWQPAQELGVNGTPPWTRLALGDPQAAAAAAAVSPIGRFRPAPGFRVETVAEGIGSLIALAIDGKGGIWVSAEGEGIKHLSDADGDRRYEVRSLAARSLVDVHGLAFAHGSLWAVGPDRKKQYGLWRIHPVNEAISRVGAFKVSDPGHGAHAVVAGPDGRMYVSLGNHTQLESDVAADSPYRITYEGHLLEPYADPRGYGASVRAPGGTLVSFDPRGNDWRTVAGGLRNIYDFAFNHNGDLIAFDSDMEWDIGLPWYQPVRALHIVPGAEYGSRTGSAVWPDGYADRLGALLEVGRGSPTGMALYDRSAFPAAVRGAVLVGDWSLGRIFALHLQPSGTSYRGTTSVLLEGAPLNVCDLVVDRDGSVLFVTGGRGTLGGVYRLVAEGTAEANAAPGGSVPERTLPVARLSAIPDLLGLLGDRDRTLRYVAARELERRPLADWQSAALNLPTALARAEALVTLARLNLAGRNAVNTADALAAATAIAGSDSGEPRRIVLRAIELFLIGEKKLDPTLRETTGGRLLEIFPSGDRVADRELAQLVAWLNSDGSSQALFAAFRDEIRPLERIHLLYCLRRLAASLSAEQKQAALAFLESVKKEPGGSSYVGYLEFLERDFGRPPTPAAATVPAAEPAARSSATPAKAAPAAATPALTAAPLPAAAPWGAARRFALLERLLRAPRRSTAEGAVVFAAACASCHRHGSSAGGPGPDLTTVGKRFALADLYSSLVEPSKVVVEQYRSRVVRTKDGQTYEGMPALESADTLDLLRADGTRVVIAKERIEHSKPSAVSLMPDGLLDGLTLEQSADLLAFLLAEAPAAASPTSGWKRIFDGASLDGWEGDTRHWRVAGGTLAGQAKDEPAATYLLSKGSFGDFVLEAEIAVLQGNSGIEFRATRGSGFQLAGLQADAGGGHWGELYSDALGTVGRVAAGTLAGAQLDASGWNHYVIEARGEKVRLELNGVVTAEWSDPAPRAGRIGLQLHGAGVTDVRYRNLRVLGGGAGR